MNRNEHEKRGLGRSVTPTDQYEQLPIIAIHFLIMAFNEGIGTGDLAQPLLGVSTPGGMPPPQEAFHAVYVAPGCGTHPRASKDSPTKPPTVIHLDLEAGVDRKERENRREVKRSLVAITMVLGFFVGLLINLAGFGGENLFMIVLGLRNGIDIHESCRAKIYTIAFWSAFTIVSLLVVRSVILTLLEKILKSLYEDHKGKCPNDNSTKHPENNKTSAWVTWICDVGDEEEDSVSLSLDYLDDKFLLATLIGSSLVGCITNLWMGMYYPGIGEILGTILVIGLDSCIMKKKKKRFYEEYKT